MDYEKKYKEALERAKANFESSKTMGFLEIADTIVDIFPELKESEDERIRKSIIHILQVGGYMSSEEKDKAFAYLEKQKELPFVKDVVLGYPGLYFYDGERMHFQGNPAMEEKQKEQPIELCDGACCDDDRFKIIAEAKKDIVEKTNITENELSMELPLLDGILMRVWQVGWLNKKPAELQKEQKPVEPSDEELERHQKELYDFKVFAAKQAKEHHISFVHDFEWDNFCAELLSYFNEKQKPVEIHIDNPNIEKFDPNVKITTSDSSADGDELLYVCNKSYKIGYRDGKRDAEQKPAESNKETTKE